MKVSNRYVNLTFIHQCCELAAESIPGCVLQIFVLLTKTGVSGAGPIVSIGISALTTGFASAIVTFDKDVDAQSREKQPNFYGFIPNDHGLRSRCFMLMTLMSACHNLSRSIGCALLAASGGATMVLSFVGGEVVVYLMWKALRRDLLYWFKVDGFLGIFGSFLIRVLVKVIVDFSGCFHFR